MLLAKKYTKRRSSKIGVLLDVKKIVVEFYNDMFLLADQQDAENENSKSCTELTESITDIDIHETDSSPIEKLDDDHLRIIFSYLSKRQLIGIERGEQLLLLSIT